MKQTVNAPSLIIGIILGVFTGFSGYSHDQERCIYCTKFNLIINVRDRTGQQYLFCFIKRKTEKLSKKYELALQKAKKLTDLFDFIHTDGADRFKIESAQYDSADSNSAMFAIPL